MKQFVLLIVIITLVLSAIISMWRLEQWRESNVRIDYELIEPEPGVRCVVVNRMARTGVDCWKTE